MSERLRKTREFSVGNARLIEEGIRHIEENGIKVLRASTAHEALAIVQAEIERSTGISPDARPTKPIVKSKSNVTKEIGLSHFLEEMGYEVIETDLGDRIIQLANEPPAHPTGPACHLSRYDIAQLFTKHFGRECRPEPEELTRVMRNEIDEYFKNADIGITGANALAAEEGAILIVHNEGNVTRASLSPKKHIVVAGIDKFYPNVEEAINAIKLQTYHATGAVITAFINIISSPSKTADIEKQLYKGMHGPSEVVLVLVDNGRSQAVADGLGEALYCIGCGGCLLECPIYDRIGNVVGYAGYLGGIGAVKASLISPEKAINSALHACTLCGACEVACPAKIATHELAKKARKRCWDAGLGHPSHMAMVRAIEENGNIYGEKPQPLPHEGENADVVVFAGCVGRFREREALDAVFSLFDKLKIKYSTIAERCCGGALEDVGAQPSEEHARYNVELAKKQGAKKLVAICPKCYLTMNARASGLEVVHISQFIEKMELGKRSGMKVTYHDPCDLGRHAGIFDAPRTSIGKVADIVELTNARANSKCCGAGGGVRGAFPTLSVKVARARCDEAASLGVDALITDCPSCVHNLANSKARKHTYKVMTIAQLLDSIL